MRLATQTQDFGVRVTRAFQNQRVGDIIFPTAIYREALLKGHWVEVVVPEVPSEITEDVPAAPVNRAIDPGRRSRRQVA